MATAARNGSMRLLVSLTSPYARKVRIAIIEAGLSNRIEVLPIDVLSDPAELRTANPLGKVPVLIRDDGSMVQDSRTIIEYLDLLADQPRFVPGARAARMDMLIRAALVEGLLDVSLMMVLETRRPDAPASAFWLDRWQKAAIGCIGRLENCVPEFGVDLDLASIGLIVALEYLDFRLSQLGWREGHSRLESWYDRWERHPSVVATRPPLA